MAHKPLTFKQLQALVAREKEKATTASERRALELELKQLREGSSTKLLKRFSRGFKILAVKGAKATGRGIVKAQKFARESGAGEGLDDIKFASALSTKQRIPKQRTKIIRVVRRPKKRNRQRSAFIARRVKVKSPRRKVSRVVESGGGFFGGFSDLGI